MALARTFKAASFILLAVGLTGCLDMKQDIWINPDGSGRLRIDTGISKSMSFLSESEEQSPEESQESDLGADFREMARELNNDERVRSVHVEEFEDEDFDRAAIDLVVHDWHDLADVNEWILTRQGAGSESDIDTYMLFSLQEEEDGTIHYLQPVMEESASAGSETGEGDFAEAMGRSMAEAMFREGALTVTLHSPTISRTNGEWQIDKSSVRWSVDLVDLMVEPASIEQFTAEIGPSARSSHFWRIIGILLAVSLLVLLLAWFSQGRRDRRKAHEVVR